MEANQSLNLTDIPQVRALVIDGKPLPLAKQIMMATNDTERIELLTGAVGVCSQALTTEAITPTKANLRMRQICALDGSDDNNDLLAALKKLEELNPAGCQAVIRSLSATTMLSLAQPDTDLAAFIVENATPGQLASVANSITGEIYISKLRQRSRQKTDLMGTNNQSPRISDDPELTHFRQKAIRRQLGQLLDLIDEAGDEPLERFALAITKYQPESDGSPSSTLFDTIYQLALEDERESAIDLIQALPETPGIIEIKIKLGLKDE